MKNDLRAFVPKARSEEIIFKEVDGELLIYDRVSDRAHCLNGTAAAIWKLCDGERNVSEISWQLRERQRKVRTRQEVNPHVEDSNMFEERVVRLALDQLHRGHLLDKTSSRIFSSLKLFENTNIARREVLRRIGLGAAIALPVVISMTAPTPAEAAVSCKHHCEPCSSPVECCGTCSTSVPGCMGVPMCT